MKKQLKILVESCRSLRSGITNNRDAAEIIKSTDDIINHIEDLLCDEIPLDGEIISSYTGPGIKAELIEIAMNRFNIDVSGSMWNYSTCMECDKDKALNHFNTIISARQILENFDKPAKPSPALVPGIDF